MSSKHSVVGTGGTRESIWAGPPDPGARSGILVGASFVAGVAAALSLADTPYPRPGSEPADVLRYFRENPGAACISVVAQLISAASLARFTASVAKLASRSGRGSGMLRKTAVAGGALAAASLATSALLSAILTGHRSEQESDAAALHFVAKPAAWFIPAGRFSGLLVSGIVGARLGGRPR